MRSDNRNIDREKHLQEKIDEQYVTVVTGGPTKYHNRQKRRKVFAELVSLPAPELNAPWFTDLCGQLRSVRISRGMTQRNLAHDAQTTQSLICQIENHKANPTAEMLERICQILKVKISFSITD